MGLFQGSLVPAGVLMNKNWLPTGPERPVVERVMQVLGLIGGGVLATRASKSRSFALVQSSDLGGSDRCVLLLRLFGVTCRGANLAAPRTD